MRQPDNHFDRYLSVKSRVRSLTIVLNDVKVVLPQRDLCAEQRKNLVSVFEGCHHVLVMLQSILGDYPELDLNLQGNGTKGWHHRAKRARKRMKWEPEEIERLRARITSNISLLNALNGQFTRYISPTSICDRL